MAIIKKNKVNPKVMLIDDNAGEIIIIKAALKRIRIDNIELEVYQNPLFALKHINDLLESEEGKVLLPDLIFLDLNMPQMNGSRLLKVLKDIEALRTIPIIIVTTSSIDEELENCFKLHANSILVKPLDFDEYVDMLDLTLR